MIKRYDGYAQPSGGTQVVMVRLELGAEEQLGDLPIGKDPSGEPVGVGYTWGFAGGHGPFALAESLAQDVLGDCNHSRLLEIVREDPEVWGPVLYKVSRLPVGERGEPYSGPWHHEWSIEQPEVLSWMMPGLLKYMV